MTTTKSGRLILLCGPSGIGKTPLEHALQILDPELSENLQRLIVYNNRLPRPGEADGVDYYFRTNETLESMRKDKNFIVTKARGDLQAVDIKKLQDDLSKGDILYEGNTLMARALQLHEHLEDVNRLSVFLSPLSKAEIDFFKEPEHHISLKQIVTEIMRRKLLDRNRAEKNVLSLFELNNIELRAHEAYDELKMAHHFDWIIPNHDGENSDNWSAFFYPIGEARKVTDEFANLLKHYKTTFAEQWLSDLVP
jgi:guanylate kinase